MEEGASRCTGKPTWGCRELRAACDALPPPGSVVASFFNSAAGMRWKLA